MAAVYESARRRHADKHALAIVAVVNKTVTITWHMLKTKTSYKSRNEDLYRRKMARMDKAPRGQPVVLRVLELHVIIDDRHCAIILPEKVQFIRAHF